MERNLKVEVVRGCEGLNVQINDYRVAGNKAWGGGTVIWSGNANTKTILEACGLNRTMVPLSEIYRVIAEHSNYHGNDILTALTCIAEGKEVDSVKPLSKNT